MPYDFSTAVEPDVIDTGIADITLVGGSTCLHTGDDATYLQVHDLDHVNGRGCVLQFPTVNLPVGAIANLYMTMRYEHVSGANSGYPQLINTVYTGVLESPLSTDAASAGDGVFNIDTPLADEGDWSPLFPAAPTDAPTQWSLGMAFDAGAPSDFRIYDIVLHVVWRMPVTITAAPPCRIHPREDHLGAGSGRIWPPPRSHQASPRRAGGYY
jgi:hypothetical protein